MEIRNDENKIKENLYSRQIGTYGEEAMNKIVKLKILILGMKGLGIEVAKNIILTGPKQVIIYDPDIVNLKDLGTNYYLKEEYVNRNRLDESCINSLKKLNPYTKIEILNIKNEEDFYKQINQIDLNVIVQTEIKPEKEIIKLDEYCREKKIKFIYSTVLGLFGFIFSDFGKEHKIFDDNGKEPKKFLCKNISNSQKGIISLVNEFDTIFNLNNGDYVLFKNVKGMTELNDNKPRKINVIDENSFSIDENTTNYQKFEGNGDVYEYKMPYKNKYISFKESINIPFTKLSEEETFTEQQEDKKYQNNLYLSFILAIGEYLNDNKNNINDDNDAKKIILNSEFIFNKMIEHEKKIGVDNEGDDDDEIQNYDKNIAYNIIKYSQYKIIPMCSLIGGFVSQEIIKVTGKYTPLNQWMFFNLYDYKFEYGKINNNKNINNRYHDQICIFGEEIQNKLQNLNIFICGAGAVGCELLKNLALMGVSTEKNSLLTITDYDNIENSNLNRQFLFNNQNINQSKSRIACKEIKKMNKEFNCKDFHLKVNKESENIFNKEFWTNQDFVFSAVDNNLGRKYLINQCYKYNKIFLNIGTSGITARADIVIPKITYPLHIDINENINIFNMCTVKKFPTKIEHCVEWANEIFYQLFHENIKLYNIFLSDKDKFIKEASKEPDDIFLNKFEIVKSIYDILINDNQAIKTDKILELSIHQFYNLYYISIKNLLLFYPLDSYENGVLFWSGSRKKPNPINFLDINDKMTRQFLYCFCYIFSHCLNIDFNYKIFGNNEIISKTKIIFDKIKNQKINVNINEEEKNNLIKQFNVIKDKINNNSEINLKINELEFEKDGLTNNHIEFIQACSNLRARNYNITEENKNKILMISGKIIPSVPTSTSSIVGYLCIQLINLLYSNDTENVVRNAYADLGLNIFDLIKQKKIEEIEKDEKKEESKYPIIQIKGSKTCREFLDHIKEKYNYDIFHFEINNKIIYDKRVTKDPHINKRELEKSKKKIEDLYFQQTKNKNEEIEEENKNLMIKINCRKINEKNEIIETIYNYPLIKYEYI